MAALVLPRPGAEAHRPWPVWATTQEAAGPLASAAHLSGSALGDLTDQRHGKGLHAALLTESNVVVVADNEPRRIS